MATPMLDPQHPLAELLRRDQRFHFDSYVFVFDALRYAQEQLNLGQPADSDPTDGDPTDGDLTGSDPTSGDPTGADPTDHDLSGEALGDDDDGDGDAVEQHVTGQELCKAMRLYALEQYGLLARSVLNHWGVRTTGDFGEIVFNLIEIGQMRKTDQDRREDFDDVFSFDQLADDRVFSLVDSSDES